MSKSATWSHTEDRRGSGEYIPPVTLLYKVLGIEKLPSDQETISVSTKGLRDLISLILERAPVDDAWYRGVNADVAAAIIAGVIPSAKDHYIRAGYFEGRLPCEPTVDEAWYLTCYPDVAEAQRKGMVGSAKAHFRDYGREEGRAGVPEHEAASNKWINLVRTSG